MERVYFEDLLRARHADPAKAETMWDARARTFGARQQRDATGFTARVTAALDARGVLKGAEILDVGGGTGRYAIPFSMHARHVTMTDISGNMLARAAENAKAAGRENLSYEKLDWTPAAVAKMGWTGKFDLVFASMCPAVHSPEGLSAMNDASREFCQINQFIEDTDSVSLALDAALGTRTTAPCAQ